LHSIPKGVKITLRESPNKGVMLLQRGLGCPPGNGLSKRHDRAALLGLEDAYMGLSKAIIWQIIKFVGSHIRNPRWLPTTVK